MLANVNPKKSISRIPRANRVIFIPSKRSIFCSEWLTQKIVTVHTNDTRKLNISFLHLSTHFLLDQCMMSLIQKEIILHTVSCTFRRFSAQNQLTYVHLSQMYPFPTHRFLLHSPQSDRSSQSDTWLRSKKLKDTSKPDLTEFLNIFRVTQSRDCDIPISYLGVSFVAISHWDMHWYLWESKVLLVLAFL